MMSDQKDVEGTTAISGSLRFFICSVRLANLYIAVNLDGLARAS